MPLSEPFCALFFSASFARPAHGHSDGRLCLPLPQAGETLFFACLL